MSKKVLSMLLAVVLVVTSLSSVLVFNASAATNLVTDGGFEGATISSIKAVTNATTFTTGIWGPLASQALFTEKTDSTGTYLESAAGTDSAITFPLSLKANHTYRLQFDSMIDDADESQAKDQASFYRAGFIKTDAANLGGNSFKNSYLDVYPKGHDGTWERGLAKEYTPTADEDVLVVIGKYNNQASEAWYVDNILVYNEADLYTVTPEASGEGSVSDAVTGFKGETVTVTATPDTGASFIGWFKGNEVTPLSTDLSYSFAISETCTLTAKFENATAEPKLIANGDFEDETLFTDDRLDQTREFGVWGKWNSNVGYYEVADRDVADSASVYGEKHLKSGTRPNDTNNYIRSVAQLVKLDINTDYVLHFMAKSTNDVNASINKTTVDNSNQAGATSYRIENAAYVQIKAGDDWNAYKIEFNSGENTEAAVLFGNNAQKAGVLYYIDNVVLEKVDDGSAVVDDFEDGDTNGWSATNGTIEAVNKSSNSWIGVPEIDGGNYAAKFTATDDNATATSPNMTVEAGKTYSLVFYTRHAGTQNQTVNVNINGGTLTGLTNFDYTTNLSGTSGSNHAPEEGVVSFKTYTLWVMAARFTATADAASITFTLPENGSAVHLDRFVLYSDAATLATVNNAFEFKGTAIRTEGVQGLRFKNTVKESVLEDFGSWAKVVEYGTVAIRSENLADAELVVGGVYAGGKSSVAGAAYIYDVGKGLQKDYIFDHAAYGRTFTGVLINIKPEYYADDYSARTYAKVRFADGSEKYVYGAVHSYSVKTVAEMVVADSAVDQSVKDYINNNILNK